MPSEAYKLARATLRAAIELGWSRVARGHYDLTTGERIVTRKHYAASPGRFEGEHWSIAHFYNANMNGDGEPVRDGLELLEVTDDERAAFGLKPDTAYIALEFSEQGFVSQFEMTEAQRTELDASLECEEEF